MSVRGARTEAVVLEVCTDVIRVLRRAHEPIVPVRHERRLLAVGVGVVRGHPDVLGQGLLVCKLEALHPTLGVDWYRQQVRYLRSLRNLAAVREVAPGGRTKADVVPQIHVEKTR